MSGPILRRGTRGPQDEQTQPDTSAERSSRETSSPVSGDLPPISEGLDVSEASPDGLDYIFQIAKNEVDTQFKISERLDAKARGLFAATGVIFAAAQAIALRKDVLNQLSHNEHTILVVAAIVAGVLVGAALLTTAFATFVRDDKSVKSEPLFEWLTDLRDKRKPDVQVAREAVEGYITLMHRRREANNKRANWLLAVQWFCGLAITASVVELVFAVHSLS
jgi:hypothetical protein